MGGGVGSPHYKQALETSGPAPAARQRAQAELHEAGSVGRRAGSCGPGLRGGASSGTQLFEGPVAAPAPSALCRCRFLEFGKKMK